jgi:hypothetical protein
MKRFFILVMCLCMAVPINVCAANQKIKVNPVYQNSKVIKGKQKEISGPSKDWEKEVSNKSRS